MKDASLAALQVLLGIHQEEHTRFVRELGEASDHDRHDNAGVDDLSAKILDADAKVRAVKAQIRTLERESEVDTSPTLITIEVDGEQETWQIAPANVASPSRGQISHRSALARAVLGQVPGTVVTVHAPTPYKATIIEIR